MDQTKALAKDCQLHTLKYPVLELKAMRASSGHDWMGDPLSFQAYQHLELVAETLANYIRRLGWEAASQYGPSFVNHNIVLLPPLVLAAGLGEVSRAGIILNPYLGLAFKAAAVLTNMPILGRRCEPNFHN